MPPVFSFGNTTILHCGAGRIEMALYQGKGAHFSRLQVEASHFPVVAKSEDHWLQLSSATLRSLNATRRWSGPVVLVFPAHLTLTTQVTVPRVAPAKRIQALRFAAEQALPQGLTDLVWDGAVSGRRAGEEDILLVAVKRNLVEQVCTLAQAAGFEPERIIPAAMATLAAYRLARPTSGQPELILNLGEKSTLLLQVETARFAARTLALGWGNQAGRDGGKGDFPAPGSTQAFAAQLGQEITRSIRHFGGEGSLAAPEKIQLTGGTPRLAGLAEILAASLNLPVESLRLPDGMEGPGVPDPTKSLPSPFVELAGAAAIQYRSDQLAINLLPPAHRRRAVWRQRRPWLTAVAILAAVALLPPIVHYRRLGVAAKAKTVAMEKALAPLRSREERIRANLAEVARIKSQVVGLQSLQARQAAWLRLLDGLQVQLAAVEDAWLERLQALPRAENGPRRLAIAGRMLDPAELADGSAMEISRRMKILLAGIAGLPEVAAVEGERFDHSQPGLLRFDFILVINPTHSL